MGWTTIFYVPEQAFNQTLNFPEELTLRALLERGYVVFAAMHGSQPKFSVSENRHDMPRAIRYIRHHAERFVDDYNSHRLHSGIGYVTPADKLAGREQAIFDERDRKLAEARARRARKRQQQREDLTAA